ncbi:MAG TPA: DUF4344 domain-containing metallopeptidase [Woeseiaceae bacterium]|nr:DUF4344 domain-containing metallopeptidase [Woeseiaceae bacterium]
MIISSDRIARHRGGVRFGALLIVLLSAIAIASCKAVADDSRQRRLDFVVGNFEFVLLHELAHVVIGDKDVPILGPIESTADYIATTMLLRGDGTEPTATFLNAAVYSAAMSFSTTWHLAQSSDIEIPYWRSHALSIQRHYATLCLLYGSDPSGQSHIVTDLKLPQDRAAGCPTEYAIADRGLRWLIDSYGRESGNLTRAEITFRYERPNSQIQRQALEEIRRLNLLELTVQAVEDLFAFEHPMTVVMQVCGRPEAAWQPEQRRLLICYELFDAFAVIHQYNSRRR